MPGAGNSNSYITSAWADSYFDSDTRHNRWAKLTEDSNARALLQATRQINSLRLAGDKLDPFTPQALHFPRASDPYRTSYQESWTADIGSPVQLEHPRLVTGSITVEDSEGTEYTEDADYELDLEAGTITALADGDLEDGEDYLVTYQYIGILEPIERATAEQALWLAEAASGPGGGDLLDRRALQAQGVRSVSLDGVSESYDGSGGRELCAEAQRLIEPYVIRTARVLARGG